MRVLVTAASKHGATTDIAQAIATTLREAGLDTDHIAPGEVAGVEPYDAVILGSAVYAGRWVDAARAFADRYADALATRPVWLFSSGPIGDPPKPVEDPPEVADLVERLAAHEHRVFAGRLERDELSFVERTITKVVGAGEGDFRDWEAIRAWAKAIAAELAGVAASA